jgi:hypothetical protein
VITHSNATTTPRIVPIFCGVIFSVSFISIQWFWMRASVALIARIVRRAASMVGTNMARSLEKVMPSPRGERLRFRIGRCAQEKPEIAGSVLVGRAHHRRGSPDRHGRFQTVRAFSDVRRSGRIRGQGRYFASATE